MVATVSAVGTVDAQHPRYVDHIKYWTRLRDCIAGEDAVKARGSVYLPMLTGLAEDSDEWFSYIRRATFYGAARRTVEGLTGAILAKPYKVEFPDEDFLKTVGRNNTPLEVEVKKSIDEVIGISRYGVLVDAAAEENAEPFVVAYYAEDIINWRVKTVKGRDVPVMWVLAEKRTKVNPEDPFQESVDDIYRVLRLETPDTEPTYTQQVYVKQKDKDGKESFRPEEKIYPKMRGGRPITEIPFVVMSPLSLDPDPDDEMLLPLVNTQLSHYQNAADLEHGLHFTALPQPYATGVDPNSRKMYLGSSSILLAERAETQFGMLEFSGAGLNAIADRMKEKEHMMAILGARLLHEEKREAEAAETLKLRQTGESSALGSVAGTVSAAWTKILGILALWRNGAATVEDVLLQLNRDFGLDGVDPAMIAQLMMGIQNGTVSWHTLHFNLSRGNVYPDDWKEEDEVNAIKVGPPGGVLGLGTNKDGGDDPGDDSDLIETGEAEGHTHSFRDGDKETSVADGHSHAILADGTLSEVNGHSHEV